LLSQTLFTFFVHAWLFLAKGKTHSGTNRIYIITSVNRGEPGLVNLD